MIKSYNWLVSLNCCHRSPCRQKMTYGVGQLILQKKFLVRSLMDDLIHSKGSTTNDLYLVTWKDSNSKKIKVFLWELRHGGINIADWLHQL